MKASDFLDNETVDEFLESPLEGVTTLDDKYIGEKGLKYLSSRLPAFTQTIMGKQFSGTPEQVNQALIEAAAIAEEANLTGGDPRLAEVKALRTFTEKVKPF